MTGGYAILMRASDGTGVVDTLYRSDVTTVPTCWSSDGKYLFMSRFEFVWQLCVMPPSPGATATCEQGTRFSNLNAQLSTDGRWLAYSTTETGRMEVFVQAYPGPGGRHRISTAGGSDPRWRADGRELFYRNPEGALMAVPIRVEGTELDVGTPVMLFQRSSPAGIGPLSSARNSYDVTWDGQRFLVNGSAEQTNREGAINVIVGWTAAGMRR